MSQLIIEYVLEGHQRGYNFTSPTTAYDEASRKAIWRSAMPRGQGWGQDAYIGARSIKCFPLPDERIAVSEVTVTDLEDESGRRGIRRAVIDVMTSRLFTHHIQSRLAGYPAEISAQAEEKYRLCRRHFPRLKKDMPLVLSHPFQSPQQWWVMEALIMKLALSPMHTMRRWEPPITFTTLALDYLNESQVVALPAEKAASITETQLLKT